MIIAALGVFVVAMSPVFSKYAEASSSILSGEQIDVALPEQPNSVLTWLIRAHGLAIVAAAAVIMWN